MHRFIGLRAGLWSLAACWLATAVVAKWEGELAPEHALGTDDVVPPDMIPGEIPAMAGH